MLVLRSINSLSRRWRIRRWRLLRFGERMRLDLSLSHTHTLSHTHSLTLSLSHTLGGRMRLDLSLSLSHTLFLTHTLVLSLPLSLTQKLLTFVFSLTRGEDAARAEEAVRGLPPPPPSPLFLPLSPSSPPVLTLVFKMRRQGHTTPECWRG